MEYAWVVSKDDEVEAVLECPALHVRPPGSQVPGAMRGTALADIFARLARMNEGTLHAKLRGRVQERLASWDLERVRELTAQAVGRVGLQDVASYVVAKMIGMHDVEEVLPFVRDFAAAVAGGASDDAIARGAAAIAPLTAALPACDDPDEAANALGLLFQTHAATAALIENLLHGRTNAPVLLTRRYAAEDVTIGGAEIRKGDALCVLLTSPRFHFGAGRHECPGRRIAETIAETARMLPSSHET